MFISKLVLNPASYQVQKELGNPYELHRTIMNAFPDNLKRIEQDGRILFRIEKEKTVGIPSVLMQSFLCPNWDILLKKEHYLLKDPVFKQFQYPEFLKGTRYWFKLFANPTKKVDGKRIGFYKEEDQYNWLKRKAENSGFNIIYVNITRKEEIISKAKNNGKTMTFQGVQFEGALQVKDPLLLKNTLKNGIGTGKAFGFGFLTISKS